MLDAVGITISTLYIAWFAISVAAQVSDRVSAEFPRMSMFALVPHWTFFAPRPGVHDVHLLYRDRSATGENGTVSCVPTIRRRRLFHAIWNPRKYNNKIVSDCSDSLFDELLYLEKHSRDPRTVLLSTPYLMLLNIAMSMPLSVGAVARQFIIAQSVQCGSRIDREIIFVSEYHKLDGVRG